MSRGHVSAFTRLLVLSLSIAVFVGCSPSEESVEADEAVDSKDSALDEYLPRLAEAYRPRRLWRRWRPTRRSSPSSIRWILDLQRLRYGTAPKPPCSAIASIRVLDRIRSEKEIAVMEKRIEDLLRRESGQTACPIAPKSVQDRGGRERIFNYANAFVTSLETWDLRVYAAGTARGPAPEALDQRNRVKYQMKRRDL